MQFGLWVSTNKSYVYVSWQVTRSNSMTINGKLAQAVTLPTCIQFEYEPHTQFS
jgi:hypothetical protein